MRGEQPKPAHDDVVEIHSETPEQRRERHIQALAQALDRSQEAPWYRAMAEMYDALLDALEPPVAEMVRRGVESMNLPRNYPWDPNTMFGNWYRPRAEGLEFTHPDPEPRIIEGGYDPGPRPEA